MIPSLLMLFGAFGAEAAPPPFFSGGLTGAYDAWKAQQERDRKRRQREREAAEDADDPVTAEIAALLHEQAEREAQAAELERLRALVAALEPQTSTLASDRIQAARQRLEAAQTRAALEAYARELTRALEEEEFLALVTLTVAA